MVFGGFLGGLVGISLGLCRMLYMVRSVLVNGFCGVLYRVLVLVACLQVF